tara:strand:+ start:256 stop:465 length:210 start_codon:yes stop_codon:yes gene_type:complete
VEPIYSLFDLKTELSDYLLNEYQYIIEYNNENDEINDENDDENESWEKSFNDALLRLGNYLLNENVKIS